MEEARWLHNGLTCRRRDVINSGAENALGAGFCVPAAEVCPGGDRTEGAFSVESISVLGGRAGRLSGKD